jgi:hypothetical protein
MAKLARRHKFYIFPILGENVVRYEKGVPYAYAEIS